MNIRLDERVALVTGAGSGIGRAIAVAFAGAGADVALIDVNLAAVERVANEIESRRSEWHSPPAGRAVSIGCDVTGPAQVQEAVRFTAESFGGLHILVNCAGVSPLRPFEDISLEEWNHVLAVNLTGPFLFSQAGLPYIRQAGSRGRIINIGSLAGQTGGIAVGAHYSASKGGLMALTKQLAKILASQRATANIISPGTTDTPLTQAWGEDTRQSLARHIPLGRLGEPEDVASLALFLASDEASFITGATINVNGGLFVG
jgi:3-oxoacyl-[acyl-carrier protein] reductase